nr:hypothetical protein [Tanacetum cinerariifolium]
MMVDIYQDFKGQLSSTPSGSVTLTLALTHILANVEGENATNTVIEEPPSHTERETIDTTMAIPISSIHPTEDKEEKMKKVVEETKLLDMSRPEVIKVVREEAKKPRINPKEEISTKRYKRLNKIPKELGIQSTLPALVPEQVSTQTSGRKRKHMGQEPEIKVPRLECNRSLPKGVPFVKNMVIEEPEYRIFFTYVFGDQAFQRRDDIHKVRMDSLISYLVMASMVKTKEKA